MQINFCSTSSQIVYSLAEGLGYELLEKLINEDHLSI